MSGSREGVRARRRALLGALYLRFRLSLMVTPSGLTLFVVHVELSLPPSLAELSAGLHTCVNVAPPSVCDS